MTTRVTLPPEYADRLRVGQLLKVESVSGEVILTAVEQPGGYAEPELFIGSNWDGLSFEIPAPHIPRFVAALASALGAERITLCYSNGTDQSREVSRGEVRQAVEALGAVAASHDFSAELGPSTLYAGGEGCFSLSTNLPPPTLRSVAQAVLDALGIAYTLDRDDFQIGLVNGRLEVYR